MNHHHIIFEDVNIRTLNLKYKGSDLSIPVHFGGMPCEVESNKWTVEDCAHAMGSRLRSNNIKCFSFHAIKNLSMPTGGAIALYDDQYVDELKEKRWCGISVNNGKRDVKRLGWNYVMNDISAVMGIDQLRHLDNNNARRRDIAKEYHDRLECNYKMPYNRDCCYHLYWILVRDRDEFRRKMSELGIETGTHYPSIDRYSYFNEVKLPVTHYVSDHIVTLPIHPNLENSDLDMIIKSANSLM